MGRLRPSFINEYQVVVRAGERVPSALTLLRSDHGECGISLKAKR
jgi:hypothetical protein